MELHTSRAYAMPSVCSSMKRCQEKIMEPFMEPYFSRGRDYSSMISWNYLIKHIFTKCPYSLTCAGAVLMIRRKKKLYGK